MKLCEKCGTRLIFLTIPNMGKVGYVCPKCLTMVLHGKKYDLRAMDLRADKPKGNYKPIFTLNPRIMVGYITHVRYSAFCVKERIVLVPHAFTVFHQLAFFKKGAIEELREEMIRRAIKQLPTSLPVPCDKHNFTELDFHYIMYEQAINDPESIFRDDRILEMFFGKKKK